MKWTTRDPRTGKKVTHFVDSGVQHNPPPSTERGRRRAAKRQNKSK